MKRVVTVCRRVAGQVGRPVEMTAVIQVRDYGGVNQACGYEEGAKFLVYSEIWKHVLN